MEQNSPQFHRSLSLLDGTLLVIGSMIGSGIFIVSADMTRHVGGAGWLILVWVITGVMTMMAAISYGELSGMFPRAGGQYVYLKEAYNKLVGFLYGWSFFAVIQTATIAAVGTAFAKFTGYFFPVFNIEEQNILLQLGSLKIYPAQFLSIATILLLTYINSRGVKEGKYIQLVFTISKLLALFGLIIFGFLLAKENFWQQNWQGAWTAMEDSGRVNETGNLIPSGWKAISGVTLLGAIAAAMVGSVFSSDAWNNVTFIAGEIKNPQRNIGLSLFLGTLTVTILYIAMNLMYLYVLPMTDVAFARQDRVAVAAAGQIFGTAGPFIAAALIMVSTFGCNNGLIMSGARVYYTMAQDGLFFKKAAQLNKAGVPQWALWMQCIIASLLCLSGRYGDLLDMISFVVVLFYVLTIAGIFILRRNRPELPRPYRAFGYPVLPALYILLGISFCVLLILFKPGYTWPGLIIVLMGIPIYYLIQKRTEPTDKDAQPGRDI